MSWYLKVLRNYAVFHGRARRQEYWYFVLINVIISVALAIVDGVTGTYNSDVGLGLLSGIYTLAVLIPGIAVSVRRLHDIGRSGWWLLIVLVPLVGAIVLFIFMVLDSKPEQNEYGPSPKYSAA
jgi:uncharacterized membrane protein YhaH (DUF805 family)